MKNTLQAPAEGFSHVPLAQSIKVFRTKRGFSQKELSEASGVSQGQLSKIERGEHIPAIDNLNAIAKALKIPTSLITYLAFDRGNIEDEFSRKMFDTYDTLLNFWLYAKSMEWKNEEASNQLTTSPEQANNKAYLLQLSKELTELRYQGIRTISGNFIEEYLSTAVSKS